jgi:hypothetical protein
MGAETELPQGYLAAFHLASWLPHGHEPMRRSARSLTKSLPERTSANKISS